jgi:SNF2 family DNA or RNA helicase
VRGVWRREIERHAGRLINVCVLEKGTTKEKVQIADGVMKMAAAIGRPMAIVVNYETARLEPFASWSLGREWDCVILDESHRCKSHNSQVSKYAAKLGRKAKRRLCLTGTPLAQSPLDLFGQFRFLDPGLFGTSWHHFSNRYAIKGNAYIPQQITGYKNQDELQQRFHLISYRCRASDVLDLPEVIHEERICELSPPARKAYRQLEEDLIADLGTGVCVASNALVRLLRLQQITSGFLVEDQTDKLHRLDTGKQDLLAELLEDAGGEPFVVFCRFRADLAATREVCEKLGLCYGELSGASKCGLTNQGEMCPNINVLGAQIQSGGLGIDLTRARYACYFSLGFSLCEYEQSLARLHRPGQKRTVFYYHLLAENTVDRRVYAALRARKDVIEAVLEGMRDQC